MRRHDWSKKSFKNPLTNTARCGTIRVSSREEHNTTDPKRVGKKEVMTMTKMTYGEALSHVLTNCTLPEEVAERLTALQESLAKRNANKTSKPTKTQRENADVKVKVMELLTANPDGMQAKDVAVALELTSPQKASALLNQLVKSGELEKVEGEKKVTLFKVKASA